MTATAGNSLIQHLTLTPLGKLLVVTHQTAINNCRGSIDPPKAGRGYATLVHPNFIEGEIPKFKSKSDTF